MLSKYNVSLDTVLHIPSAARYFTMFLESEYAQENIHYVLSVNEYKEAFPHSDHATRWEMARIIYDHFVAEDGDQMINIDYRQRQYIIDRVENGNVDVHIFDISQQAIYTLLERDCFPRFKQSHYFHEFLNEAENQALCTKEEYERQQRREREIESQTSQLRLKRDDDDDDDENDEEEVE